MQDTYLTTILSKSQLRKAVTESLFKPIRGKTLACMKPSRFDLGKYKPGSMVGQNLPEHYLSWVYAVWVEPRKDKDGPYDDIF